MRAHTRLEVYWDRLAQNWESIQKLAPSARILPMIKANAYGHGLVPVAHYLSEELKAQGLGVASLGEAEAVLRDGKIQCPVFVFSDSMVTEREYHSRYSGKQIIPVIHDMSGLEVFLTDRCFKHLPLMLKLNTGMNRLGLNEDEWESAGKLILQHGRKNIHHLVSHLARSAEELKAGDKSHRQKESFEKGKSLFRGMGISIDESSLANSGAIEQQFACDETWVRPGLMLYGPPSVKPATKLVSSLVTRVMKVFPIKRGVPVGYSVSVPAEDGVIAVLPIGYGDGFPTQSTGHSLSVNGMKAKVFGRINMDMAFLFFSNEALGKINVGDEVRFWNEEPAPLLEWASHMQTHAYQALCGIGSRVPRVYRLG